MLTAWEAALSLGGWVPACLRVVDCVDTPVIFPSFLNKLLNLFTCLCLTLWNLILPTFSTKSWNSLNLCVDKIDANFDLYNSVCLPTLSRILFMALTLALSRFLSTCLIIFLALLVFIVVFSLMMNGTKSLCIHLKVKIL